ncbi:carbonate dehydratase, eukaryotic-type, partial [Cooperia oncophora]
LSSLYLIVSVVIDGFKNWGEQQPYIKGGGLKHRYKDHEGSEHKIGGLYYPSEVHLVHLREGMTLQEAVKERDGTAVVAVFFAVSLDGRALSSISPSLDKIVSAGNYTLMSGFRARPLLPANTDAFYRYEGSVPTPNCDEAVIWTVFGEPNSLTQAQLEQLRRIVGPDGSRHKHNSRPIQPLNGRRIRYKPSLTIRGKAVWCWQALTIITSLLLASLRYMLYTL